MASIDRHELIDLLDRLGAGEETALAAARALHQKMRDAELNWSDVMRAPGDAVFGGSGESDAAPTQKAAGSSTADGASPEWAEAARLIDRMLARSTISETLRADLTEMKRNLAKGEFDSMDARYVGALAKRLGA